MANNCFYQMRVTTTQDNEAEIDRLFAIMKYEDPKRYIYRVFSVSEYEEREYEDGLVHARFCGDVAWAANEWFTAKSHKYGEKKYTSLRALCRGLNLAIELWSEETGVGFQQHFISNNLGKLLCQDEVPYSYDPDDDDPEGYGEGGFDNYGSFSNNIFIRKD